MTTKDQQMTRTNWTPTLLSSRLSFDKQDTQKNAVVETSVLSVTVVAPQKNKQPATLSVRESRRINKEEKSNEKELIANFNTGTGFIYRGTKKKKRIVWRTSCGLTCSSPSPSRISLFMIPARCTGGAQAGHLHLHADGSESDTSGGRIPGNTSRRASVGTLGTNRTRIRPHWYMPAEFNDDTFRNVYWRALRLQFKEHIQMEVALQHFWQSGYYLSEVGSVAAGVQDDDIEKLERVFAVDCGQEDDEKEFVRESDVILPHSRRSAGRKTSDAGRARDADSGGMSSHPAEDKQLLVDRQENGEQRREKGTANKALDSSNKLLNYKTMLRDVSSTLPSFPNSPSTNSFAK